MSAIYKRGVFYGVLAQFLVLFLAGKALAVRPPDNSNATGVVCTDCVDGSDLSDTETADADKILSLGGNAFTVSGGTVTLSSNSIVDAYNLSFGAVTADSTSTVTWTEVTDRLGEFTTSSFTAVSAGYYEVTAHAGASQTAGSACLLLKVNDAKPLGGEACNQGVTGLASVLDVSITRVLSLAANDIVRLDASATTADATFLKMTLTIKKIP